MQSCFSFSYIFINTYHLNTRMLPAFEECTEGIFMRKNLSLLVKVQIHFLFLFCFFSRRTLYQIEKILANSPAIELRYCFLLFSETTLCFVYFERYFQKSVSALRRCIAQRALS